MRTINGGEKIGKYRVYFDQVNATYFDVSARSKDEALKKGRKEWKESLDGFHPEATVERLK